MADSPWCQCSDRVIVYADYICQKCGAVCDDCATKCKERYWKLLKYLNGRPFAGPLQRKIIALQKRIAELRVENKSLRVKGNINKDAPS